MNRSTHLTKLMGTRIMMAMVTDKITRKGACEGIIRMKNVGGGR